MFTFPYDVTNFLATEVFVNHYFESIRFNVIYFALWPVLLPAFHHHGLCREEVQTGSKDGLYEGLDASVLENI